MLLVLLIILSFILKSPQIRVNDVLLDLSKNQLIDIILKLIDGKPVLEKQIIMKHFQGNDQQELDNYLDSINTVLTSFTASGDYITYKETSELYKNMGVLLEKVTDTMASGKVILALEMAITLYQNTINRLSYFDDSEGHIRSLFSEIPDVFLEISLEAKESYPDTVAVVFDKIMLLLDNTCINSWDNSHFDLLSTCYQLADSIDRSNRLTAKIEQLLVQNEGDSYLQELLMKLMLDLKCSYGTEEEAESFIRENLKYTSFRKEYINTCFKENNHLKVIELALEGEEQDKELPGLVKEWQTFRYQAYQQLSMKEEQLQLAKKLLFKGDLSYYKELQKLSGKSEDEFYKEIKTEIKRISSQRPHSLFYHLVLEKKDLPELMMITELYPMYIEQHAQMLKNEYKDQVIDIYQRYIWHQAKLSSKRSEYKEVGRILNRFKSIAGSEPFTKLIDSLQTTFKNRPAFRDELSKIR